jgi:hypothetical protein
MIFQNPLSDRLPCYSASPFATEYCSEPFRIPSRIASPATLLRSHLDKSRNDFQNPLSDRLPCYSMNARCVTHWSTAFRIPSRIASPATFEVARCSLPDVFPFRIPSRIASPATLEEFDMSTSKEAFRIPSRIASPATCWLSAFPDTKKRAFRIPSRIASPATETPVKAHGALFSHLARARPFFSRYSAPFSSSVPSSIIPQRLHSENPFLRKNEGDFRVHKTPFILLFNIFQASIRIFFALIYLLSSAQPGDFQNGPFSGLLKREAGYPSRLDCPLSYLRAQVRFYLPGAIYCQ